jgi:hypothetical protein
MWLCLALTSCPSPSQQPGGKPQPYAPRPPSSSRSCCSSGFSQHLALLLLLPLLVLLLVLVVKPFQGLALQGVVPTMDRACTSSISSS